MADCRVAGSPARGLPGGAVPDREEGGEAKLLFILGACAGDPGRRAFGICGGLYSFESPELEG